MASRDLVKSLIIDGVSITHQSETLKYISGNGEKTIEAFNGGNGTIEIVTGSNISTKISQISFEMPNSKVASDLVDTWQEDDSRQVVQIIFESGKEKTFEECILTSDPEIPAGSDTNISIEFKGAQSK